MSITSDVLLNLIPHVWKDFIGKEEFVKPYWKQICNTLNGGNFYPELNNIFKSIEFNIIISCYDNNWHFMY